LNEITLHISNNEPSLMMKTLFIKLYNTISFDSMVAVSLYLI